MAAQPREERKDDIKQAGQRIHVVPVERRRTVFLIGAPGSGKAAIRGWMWRCCSTELELENQHGSHSAIAPI